MDLKHKLELFTKNIEDNKLKLSSHNDVKVIDISQLEKAATSCESSTFNSENITRMGQRSANLKDRDKR